MNVRAEHAALQGAVIGDATVEEPVGVRDTRVIWRAICPCGATQLRSTGQLTYARDMGVRVLCPKCLSEWRRTRGYVRRDQRIEHFYTLVRRINPAVLNSPERLRSLLRVLLDVFGLYGAYYDQYEEAALREEFAREDARRLIDFPVTHRTVKIQEAPPSIPEMAVSETALSSRIGVNWSNLYPIETPPEDHVYHCADCERLSSRGWGCVQCMAFSCFDCVTNERHLCRDYSDDRMTLEAVGRELDVNRSRVNQIELRAPDKLRMTLRNLEKHAEEKAAAERWRITSIVPNPAREEERWAVEIERQEEGKVRQFEAALRRLHWEVLREAATLDGRPLPWTLRYAPASTAYVQFGNSVRYIDPLDAELVCCVTCKCVLTVISDEWTKHKHGFCWIAPKPQTFEDYPSWVKTALQTGELR